MCKDTFGPQSSLVIILLKLYLNVSALKLLSSRASNIKSSLLRVFSPCRSALWSTTPKPSPPSTRSTPSRRTASWCWTCAAQTTARPSIIISSRTCASRGKLWTRWKNLSHMDLVKLLALEPSVLLVETRQALHAEMCPMQICCILSLRLCSQVYDSLCRPYPRRFVLPLHISDDTPTGQNLNTRPSSQATCVKVCRDKASQSRHTVQLLHGSLLQPQCICCIWEKKRMKQLRFVAVAGSREFIFCTVFHCGVSVTWNWVALSPS